MIPVRSSIRGFYPPPATTSLIVANALVFAVELSLPRPQLDRLVLEYGISGSSAVWLGVVPTRRSRV